MRSVLHLQVPEPDGERGGADRHLLDLAREQSVLGYTTEIVEYGSKMFAAEASQAADLVTSLTGSTYRQAIHGICARIEETRPDIVHAHGYDSDYLAAFARLRLGSKFSSKLVFTQHGIVADTIWHKIKTVLDAASTRMADGVIVCAPELEVTVRRWVGSGPVSYIPNGVAEPSEWSKSAARAEVLRRYSIPQSGPLFLYVGRLSHEKRADLVIDAFAIVAANLTDSHLMIAGTGGLEQSLRRLVSDLGLTERVHFLGLVDDIGLVSSAASVQCLLSDTESTPRTVVEAMMSRTPLVATDVGAISSVVRDGIDGHIVPRRDARAAASRMETLATGEWSQGGSARARATTLFSSRKMALDVIDFYEKVLMES